VTALADIGGDIAARARRLETLQASLCAVVAACDDAAMRARAHPALSPLGWHLRHCAFVEALWVRERVLGDDSLTAPLVDDCMPERAPKDLRGARLPPREALLSWADTTMAENRAALARARGHPMLAQGYLWDFLINHHAQHLETMAMVRCALQMAAGGADETPAGAPLAPAPPEWRAARVAAGRHVIGAAAGFAFDNERPAIAVDLPAFAIAENPVSNAQYLAFMDAGGYRDDTAWDAAGRAWRDAAAAAAPYGWRRDARGGWYAVGPAGPEPLAPGAPVIGLCHHEAKAFARWAGAALPHEYQWEAAAARGLLRDAGRAWEWCANPLHGYPGFRAFPYREYSAPWFDGRHFVLRGGGRHGEAETRRPSFRNYYQPHCRHIFAGLRLRLYA